MLRFNVKNGLKVQQLAKKPSTLKMLMQKILVKHFFNFKFAEAKFLHNFLVQLNCIQQYLEQILVTIEKLLILQIVAFMTGLSKRKLLSNYWATFNLVNVNLLGNPNVNPKNGAAYKKKNEVPNSQNLQSRSPNSAAPKLRNSQFGPNSPNWKFMVHTLKMYVEHVWLIKIIMS